MAKLLAADGNLGDAQITLRRALAPLNLAEVPWQSRLRLCMAALYCEDFVAISTVLTGQCAGAVTIDIVLQDGAASPRDQNTFYSRIYDRSRLTFGMPMAAYVSPHLPFLVSRMIATLPLFIRQFQLGSREDVTIGLNVGDFGRVPGLAFCSNSNDYLLIPDSEFLQSNGYELARVRFLRKPVPWSARRDVAFWRGATTGRPTEPANGWRSLPRARLCQIAFDDRSDLFDIGISRLELPPNHVGWGEIPPSGLMRPPVPITQFQGYRYQVDIDGHTSAWGGLFQKLLTGSPVLKVASLDGWRQWYYDRLQPWTNFVPVTSDMSDLAETVRWLQRHERAARRIGEAGQALALSLSYEAEVEAGARTILGATETGIGW